MRGTGVLLFFVPVVILAEAGNEAPPTPKELAAVNEQRCNGGDIDSCLFLADQYYRGDILPKNQAKARIFFRQACTKGHGDACASLGVMLERGEGGPRDWNGAEGLYRKACDGGSAIGCNNLAVLYHERALREPRFLPKALDAYRSACAMQYEGSCAQVETLEKQLETDPAKKAERWEKECADDGNAEACHKAGTAHYLGDGMPRNPAKAATYFRKACDGGHASSCYNLALMMEQGDIPRDAKQLIALYETACEKGDARACSNAGFMFINGDGAPLDQEKGRTLFEKSCTMKHGEGCYNLGNVYEQGAGVEKDLGKALEYYTQGCALDHKKSCDAVKAAKSPKKGGKKK